MTTSWWFDILDFSNIWDGWLIIFFQRGLKPPTSKSSPVTDESIRSGTKIPSVEPELGDDVLPDGGFLKIGNPKN